MAGLPGAPAANMLKYYTRYLVFWLPAFFVATFFNNDTMLSQVLLWFTAFFMLLGWVANTGMAAYHYPRGILSTLLIYTGLHVLMLTGIYSTDFRDPMHVFLRRFGGIFSFKPLDIFVQTLKPITSISLPWEACVIVFLVACCAVGYIIGVVQRRVNPNPYSPRIRSSRW